jgi:hypothetical protein
MRLANALTIAAVLALLSAPTAARAVPILPGDYLAIRSNTELVVIDHTTGAITTIPSTHTYASSVAAGPNDAVYVADSFSFPSGVYQVEPDTGAQTLLVQTTAVYPEQVLAVASDGTLFAGAYGNAGFGRVTASIRLRRCRRCSRRAGSSRCRSTAGSPTSTRPGIRWGWR